MPLIKFSLFVHMVYLSIVFIKLFIYLFIYLSNWKTFLYCVNNIIIPTLIKPISDYVHLKS